ncbi:MAG: Stp1/IreP family PP2C-type Ser/Thr phosphatase [Muribaculaceae bacterium]|nr:Stp1/IreP family PP2C-type Ser/Thr phosphatase [Muribaculaceae bacterium]
MSKYSYCNVAQRTDVGCKRKANEDWLANFECVNGLVAVVCDGMGGHVGGAVASHLAIDTIQQFLTANRFDDPRQAIIQACDKANQALLRHTEQHPELTGMGSTCVMLIVRDGRVWMGSVGDSRIYLIRQRAIKQLTKDQSYVQTLVDSGQITPEQAEHHPRKNEIYNALGLKTMKPATVLAEPIMPLAGDCFMLCSDGLSGMVPDAEILTVVSQQATMSQQQRVDTLVQMARNAGGVDNITCQIVEFSVTPSQAVETDPDTQPPITQPGPTAKASAANAEVPATLPPVTGNAGTKKGKRRALAWLGMAAALLLLFLAFIGLMKLINKHAPHSKETTALIGQFDNSFVAMDTLYYNYTDSTADNDSANLAVTLTEYPGRGLYIAVNTAKHTSHYEELPLKLEDLEVHPSDAMLQLDDQEDGNRTMRLYFKKEFKWDGDEHDLALSFKGENKALFIIRVKNADTEPSAIGAWFRSEEEDTLGRHGNSPNLKQPPVFNPNDTLSSIPDDVNGTANGPLQSQNFDVEVARNGQTVITVSNAPGNSSGNTIYLGDERYQFNGVEPATSEWFKARHRPGTVTITVTRPEKIPLADNVIKIKTKEEGVVISLKIKIKS